MRNNRRGHPGVVQTGLIGPGGGGLAEGRGPRVRTDRLAGRNRQALDRHDKEDVVRAGLRQDRRLHLRLLKLDENVVDVIPAAVDGDVERRVAAVRSIRVRYHQRGVRARRHFDRAPGSKDRLGGEDIPQDGEAGQRRAGAADNLADEVAARNWKLWNEFLGGIRRILIAHG